MRRLALALLLALAPLARADDLESVPLLEPVGAAPVRLESLRHRGWLVLAAAAPDADLAEVASACRSLAPLGATLGLVVRAPADALAAPARALADLGPVLADPTGALAAALGLEGGAVVLDPTLARRAALPAGGWPARAVRSVAELQDGATRVDLRPAFEAFGLRVGRQGGRGTCSVFTATGAFELALAVRRGEGLPLSVEFLNWAANQATGNPRGDGQFFHSCLAGFERLGLCAEARMPYRRRHDPGAAPSEEALAEAARVRDAGLRARWIKPIDSPKGATPAELAEARRVLARGFPVAAGSYHSVLLVGFEAAAEHPGGGRFVTHDSGAGAVRHMSFQEASGRLNDMFCVEATPRPWWR